MSAIIHSPSWKRTSLELKLIAQAGNLVHPYLPAPLAKEGVVAGNGTGRGQTQLSADHLRVLVTPRVVADCAPFSSVTDLDPAFVD